MIRPIDSGTLYAHTQTISKEVQQSKDAPNLQQNSFAKVMKDERVKEREQVVKSDKNSKVQNDKKNSKNPKDEKDEKNKKDKNQKEQKEEGKNEKYQNRTSTFDMKI